jgi:hypothetical protein
MLCVATTHACMTESVTVTLNRGLGMHIIIPRARMRSKGVKQLVCPPVCLWTQKSPYLEIYAPERLVITTNQSNLAKNWLQYVSNRGIGSKRVTNTAFLLPIVATPIETTAHARSSGSLNHSQCTWHTGYMCSTSSSYYTVVQAREYTSEA